MLTPEIEVNTLPFGFQFSDRQNIRRLLLGRKVMTNLDSIFKNRDITLPTKVRLVRAMVFPVSCMDVRVGL